MKRTTLTPKYAHLEYVNLYRLQISVAEYFLLDMIHHLSREGWCNKKLDDIASDMRMTRRGVIAMRDRLVDKCLLVKGVGNRLRTSEKVNNLYFLNEDDRKSAKSSAKSELFSAKSAKSFPKNNNRITIDYGNNKNSGYEKAKSIAEIIKNRKASRA